jgi:hypothetical protein
VTPPALRTAAEAVLRRELGAVVVARLCPRCGSGAHGRPLVRLSSGPAPWVSISYAGPLAAVAWSALGPCGVDVEETGPPVDGIDRLEWTGAEASFKADGDPRLRTLRLPEGYVGSVAGDGVSWRVARA